MNDLHAGRLLLLADALQTKIPDAQFYFGSITRGNPKHLINFFGTFGSYECKSVACAIGWCPIVFPKLFEYVFGGIVEIGKPDSIASSFHAVMAPFGISFGEVEHLFCPTRYPDGDRTNRLQVAARIRSFVASKQESNDGKVSC